MPHNSKGTVNRVILIGNLGVDPEIKATNSGTSVANLSLATTTSHKDSDGKYTDKTEWHKVVVWGKTADAVGNYTGKGSKLYIEGRLETRSWEDKNGNKKYMTEVIAESVQFLDKRESGNKPNAPEPPAPESSEPETNNDLDFPF